MKASIFRCCLLIFSGFFIAFVNQSTGYCGDKAVNGELLAGIRDNAPVSVAKAAVSGAGAAVIGEIPQIRALHVRAPENALQAVKEALSRNPVFDTSKKIFSPARH